MTIALRVGNDGRVCSANVASNDMGTNSVASCVQRTYLQSSFPAPRGGCLDVNVPLYFNPGGQ